jgi:1-acyl-sn-glycerol-3-phosphate acyltransferase
MQRELLRSVIRFLFKLFCNVNIIGAENVPDEGGLILAVNHLSRLDPPLVYALLDRKELTALVANKYLTYPFFRWIINIVGGIWVDREDADIHALRVARDYLKNGGGLGIAPEGTRSRTGALILAKTGVAYLAEKAGVPIVPVAISGTETAVKRLLKLQRPHITMQFGELFRLPSIGTKDRNNALKRNTDEIMCRIAAMLPPPYRGVYADHPRLKEILASEQDSTARVAVSMQRQDELPT